MADRYGGTGSEPVERRFKSFDRRIRRLERGAAQGAPVRLSRHITVVEGDLVALEVRVAANELSIAQINGELAVLDGRITDLENALATLGFQSLIDTPDVWGDPFDLVVINATGDGLIYMPMPDFVEVGDLAPVAFSGDYDDLTNTPSFGTMAFEDAGDYTPTSGLSAVALSNDYEDLDNLPTLGTMAAEAAADYTPTSGLSAVALSNDYEDLDNLPTLGTMAAEAAADYTPTSGLAAVALSNDYNDLDNLPGPPAVTFLGLTDTPGTYAGAALMAVRVNAGATALEFVAFPVGSGDVVGPASAVSGSFASFDGATGKLIEDSGFAPGDFATATQGSTADTAVQPGDLGAVAFSNDYEDLDNLPTLGTMAAEDTGDYTPTSGLADVALSNDYEDLDNLPTLGTMAAEDAGDFTPTSGLAAVALSNDYGDLDNLPSLVTAFLGLSDTPATYAGAALQVVRVNAGANALEFATITPGSGDVVGPASAVSGNFPEFGDASGKLLADSGLGPGDFATAAQGSAADTAVQPGDLGAVALSNDYEDLDNLPTLGTMAAETAADYTPTSGLADVALSNDYGDLDNLPTLGTMAAEAAADYTPTSGLAAVALSNDYEDLDNLPTLGTMAAEDAGDYTPTSGLADVALSNDYGDLDNLPSLVTAFSGLSDTPANYSGAALQVVRVNAGENALEFFAGGSGDVVGPASSVSGNLPSFGDTSGKLLADSGIVAANVVQGFPILAPDGSAGAPSYSFASDSSVGMWGSAVGIRLSAGGATRLFIAPTYVQPNVPLLALDGDVANPPYSFVNDPGLGWYRSAGGALVAAHSGVNRITVGATGVVLNAFVQLNGALNTPFAGIIQSAIYRSASGGIGTFPFSGTGHLVLQGRSDGSNNSSIVFLVGPDADPAWTINGNPSSASFRTLMGESGGSVSAPAVTLRGDSDTGISWPDTNTLTLSANGGTRLSVNASEVVLGGSSVGVRMGQTNLTPTTGTVSIDFTEAMFRTFNIGAGNVTFTFANLLNGRRQVLRIHNTSGTTRIISWPANTKLGALAYSGLSTQQPTSLAHNRGMVIDIISWSTNATNVTAGVVAAYGL